MKPLVLIVILFCTLLGNPILAQEKQVVVPYTLADRDRAILIEAKLDSLNSRLNSRMDSVDSRLNRRFAYSHKQFNELKTILYCGFGTLITLCLIMLGYMIWDRHRLMKLVSFHTSKTEE